MLQMGAGSCRTTQPARARQQLLQVLHRECLALLRLKPLQLQTHQQALMPQLTPAQPASGLPHLLQCPLLPHRPGKLARLSLANAIF